MKDLFKSFLSFGFATSIEKILSFLLLPVYTRLFSLEDYGALDLIQVLISFLSIFCLLQLETSLQRYYYDYKDNFLEKRLVSNIVVLVTGLSILLTLILVIFSKNISILLLDSDIYSTSIKLAALQLPFTNFSIMSLIVFRFEKKNGLFLKAILIKVLSIIVCTYIFVINKELGINGVFASILISNIVAFIYQIIHLNKMINFNIDKSVLNKSLSYALPQFPARLGNATISYLNRFLMISFLSVSAIGIYSLSLKLASFVQLGYIAFSMAWTPFMFAQINKSNDKIIFPKVLDIITVIVFSLICIVTIFSKELVLIISGSKFIESSKYLGALSLYFSFFIFKEIVDVGPKKLEKTKYLTYSFTISVIVNFITMFLFIKSYGIKGVVLSMVLTNMVLFYLSLYISNKLYPIKFNIYNFTLQLILSLIVIIYFMNMDLDIIFKFILSIMIIIFLIVNLKNKIINMKNYI